MAGQMGMALFFNLSGLLITTFLQRRPDVPAFLVRRLLRILPLAWLVFAVLLTLQRAGAEAWFSHFFFLLNYQADRFVTPYNSHLWSLSVEMHFYLGVALLVALFGRRGLWSLPFIAILVTTVRAVNGVEIAIATHYRVDEILAGASVALLLPPATNDEPGSFRYAPPWLCFMLFCVTCNPVMGPAQFLRPYSGALLLASTLGNPSRWESRLLGVRQLRYLAQISYALYVVHGPLRAGWFAEGDVVLKYLVKRPLTLVLSFALAHLSTFYWESRWISLARRLTTSRGKTRDGEVPERAPPTY